MEPYILVASIAAITTYFATPLARRFATRIDAVAVPDSERHIHPTPTATLGGAAMLVGFLVAMVAASLMGSFSPMFDNNNTEPLGVILGAVLIFAVGAIDDIRGVSPPAKMAGMVLAASALQLLGVSMAHFRVPFLGFIVLSSDLAPLATVLWVVILANAINLIDGLDGLATGIVMIAAGAFFLFAFRLSQPEVGILLDSNVGPLILAITAGVCAGFLPHNWSPATIFMGDAGSMFLGLLLASATILIGGRAPDQFSGQTYFFFAPLIIPVVILGVPLIDLLFALLRRTARGKSFAIADRGHLHHRLMNLGHGPRRSVVIMWAWTALLSILVLVPTYTNSGQALVPVGVAGSGLLLYAFFHPGRHKGDQALPLPEPPPPPVNKRPPPGAPAVRRPRRGAPDPLHVAAPGPVPLAPANKDPLAPRRPRRAPRPDSPAEGGVAGRGRFAERGMTSPPQPSSRRRSSDGVPFVERRDDSSELAVRPDLDPTADKSTVRSENPRPVDARGQGRIGKPQRDVDTGRPPRNKPPRRSSR